MKVIAHFKAKDGRIAEEEFEVIESLPKVNELYEGEIVREVDAIKAIPELGIETLKNYEFYRLRLTVMKEYEEENGIFYVAYVAIRKKPFNRIAYVSLDSYDKADIVYYLNDDKKICKSQLVKTTNRENALNFIKGIKASDVEEWFDDSYEEELEDRHRGGENVLAEIECNF